MLQKPFFRMTASWSGSDRHGRRVFRSGTGISSVSREDAENRAREAAKQAVERAMNGESPGRYVYGDRLVVEPVLQRFEDGTAASRGMITVNGYGCEVLNAAGLMFVDVDIERPRPPRRGFLDWLFGREAAEPLPPDPEQKALDRLADFVAASPQTGVRVYRTAAGLRYLFTDQPYDPASAESEETMKRLGADPKYILLCRVQNCFRARLTPKPWRCGSFSMHPGFADGTDQPREVYRAWRKDYYDKAAEGYATCCFVTALGKETIHSDLAELTKWHDRTTRAESGLSLA